MPYYSKNTIQKVKQIDLLTYLQNFEPDELIVVCRGNYTTKTHDSLKISNGMWYWFSKSIGGKSALDYLIKVRGYSFMDSMKIILDKINMVQNLDISKCPEVNKTMFKLPVKAKNNDVAIKYLTKRGIDDSIINECINNSLIYQDVNNNVVFVGYNENKVPKYAMCRGTGQHRFIKEVTGSCKEYSFRISSDVKNKDLHLFESAIDLLSYATILKMSNIDWHKYNLLSFGGVYVPNNLRYSNLPSSLLNYLKNNPNIKRIILHLDNDDVGRLSAKAISNVLSGGYEVFDKPAVICKDFNDFLCYVKRNIDRESR